MQPRSSAAILACLLTPLATAWTSIKVVNEWNGGLGKTDINVKIEGEGVGGCDVVMKPSSNASSGGWTNDTTCECLWGTVGYKFHAYVPSILVARNATLRGSSASIEIPICSDLVGLGNCYDGPYTCTVSQDKLCHCSSA